MQPSVQSEAELMIPTFEQARYLLPEFESAPRSVASLIELCVNPELTINVIILLKNIDAEFLFIFLLKEKVQPLLVPEVRAALKKIFPAPTQK